MPLNADLLDILVCPACRGPLQPLGSPSNPDDGNNPEMTHIGLKCPACALVYPVRDDIPIMIQEEAIGAIEWETRYCR